jgi:predicted dinucleotide-binding enzyme
LGAKEGAGALKAFNNTGCSNVEDLAGYEVTPVMFVVVDDAARNRRCWVGVRSRLRST